MFNFFDNLQYIFSSKFELGGSVGRMDPANAREGSKYAVRPRLYCTPVDTGADHVVHVFGISEKTKHFVFGHLVVTQPGELAFGVRRQGVPVCWL